MPAWPHVPRLSQPAGDPMLTHAIRGLLQWRPDLSARGPAPRWLLPAIVLAAAVAAFGAVLEPAATGALIGLALLLPFAGMTALRLAGALASLSPATRAGPVSRDGTSAAPMVLPSYTVLVPLYDEPEVLPGLVAGLAAIDYPTDRLDILLVLEARDRATRDAAQALVLPAHMRIVLVPPGGPRTKPKALNYALGFAESELAVVFDAEDRPEPGQLKDAANAFAAAAPDLVCLQARLNIYNPADSFWSRQFALEYSALFDGFLPALSHLRLPIPLGGTSNHFRLAVLREVGAWDPYNVTEDADLGVRLARMGYRTATIGSTTWEEAPTRRRVWVGQRTRWLKGWMQTWLVHMRYPGRLLGEVGLWQFLGVQLLMAGVLLSVLVYPIALAAFVIAMASGSVSWAAMGWLYPVAIGNLVAGILVPMLAAALAVTRRGRAWLVPSVVWMPLYWMMISFAGYRALVELFRNPFHWEKTRHGLGGSTRRSKALRPVPPPPRPRRGQPRPTPPVPPRPGRLPRR